MSTQRTNEHYDGCPRKFRPVPKVRCGTCGCTTIVRPVKFGVFDHIDSRGVSTETGLVVRTGWVQELGVSYPSPYGDFNGVSPVREFERESAAQAFADRENA